MATEHDKITVECIVADWEYTDRDGTVHKVFEHETALIEMLAAGVLFLSSGYIEKYDEWLDICELCVNCNDLFWWATADAEPLPYEQVETLYRRWKEDPETGVEKWCCVQRQLRPQAPIEKRWREKGWWDDEMEALPKPEPS